MNGQSMNGSSMAFYCNRALNSSNEWKLSVADEEEQIYLKHMGEHQ